MKTENPVVFNLKYTTYEIIEKLFCSGKYSSYRSAIRYFFNKAKQKNQNTGFDLTSFDKFYNNFRKFKSKIHKNSQNDYQQI